MQLPKDCKQLAITLAVQAEVADKAADRAGKNKTDLAAFSQSLVNLTRATNIGQMSTTWFAKIAGLEGSRLDMITGEKRFKLVKGMISGAEAIPAAISAHAEAAAELAAFYPVLVEALEALDKDIQRGTDEGWLNVTSPSESDAVKQRGVYESASWFWALHARLADLQFCAEEKRVEAQELSHVTRGIIAQAVELIGTLPASPVVEDSTEQIQHVRDQIDGAKLVVENTLSRMLGMLTVAGAAEEIATGEN